MQGSVVWCCMVSIVVDLETVVQVVLVVVSWLVKFTSVFNYYIFQVVEVVVKALMVMAS